MNSAYLAERITVTKTIIEAYEEALLAIVSGGVAEYLLDTGQSRSRVTKLDVTNMNATLDMLYARLCNFEVRQSGGVVTVRPVIR